MQQESKVLTAEDKKQLLSQIEKFINGEEPHEPHTILLFAVMHNDEEFCQFSILKGYMTRIIELNFLNEAASLLLERHLEKQQNDKQ
jgi:hypothetical protein